MKKNIAFISFGTGGTLGHKTLVNNLCQKLNPYANMYVFSEYDYESHADKNPIINWVRISGQDHKMSQGGRITHIAAEEILEKCLHNNISVAIFSTFFDPDLIEKLNNKQIKTVLISYHLREQFFIQNIEDKAYTKFCRVIYLEDLYSYQLPNYIRESAPIYPIGKITEVKEKNLLITCGGGGRPSSSLFVDKMEKIIPIIKENIPNINITFVLGPNNKECQIEGVNILKSTDNFISLLNWARYVISEAGYFTVNELIQQQKPAILIPGERRIDDQELRAKMYEKELLGKFILPTDDYLNIANMCVNFIEDDSKYAEYVKNARIYFAKSLKLVSPDLIIRELL